MKKIFFYNSQEPIVVSKVTLDMLLKTDCPSDCMALYLFYYLTAKWQNTATVKATTSYTAEGLRWTVIRVRKTKKMLYELGLIQDIRKTNEIGQAIGHYVQIKFIWVESQPHPKEIPQGSVGNRVAFNTPNTKLQTNNTNTKLQTGNLNTAISQKIPTQMELFKPDEKVSPSHFEIFWELYPKKAGKGTAFSAFLKLCNQKTKQTIRPTWKVLRNALKMQKKSQLWEQMPNYIPNASTWLNNLGWLNDPEEMQVYKSHKPEKQQFGYVGSKIEYKKPIEM